MEQVLELKMKDKTEDGVTGTTIAADESGIEIAFDGYGAKTGQPGSPIIYIERYQGRIKLYAWTDINREDPTHVLDFEAAREAA